MRNLCCFVLLLFWVASGHAQSNSYLFVWAGDDAKKSNDFLAVLDANASSPHYGQVVASVAVPGPSGTPHHTELDMPEGGMLLANAFESGRTMLFDLREPLHPSLATSFGDLDGYMHPHTYVRLPNGHVLATFQYQSSLKIFTAVSSFQTVGQKQKASETQRKKLDLARSGQE
jgi:56kDa selenium binding protein (SBP56)